MTTNLKKNKYYRNVYCDKVGDFVDLCCKVEEVSTVGKGYSGDVFLTLLSCSYVECNECAYYDSCPTANLAVHGV